MCFINDLFLFLQKEAQPFRNLFQINEDFGYSEF